MPLYTDHIVIINNGRYSKMKDLLTCSGIYVISPFNNLVHGKSIYKIGISTRSIVKRLAEYSSYPFPMQIVKLVHVPPVLCKKLAILDRVVERIENLEKLDNARGTYEKKRTGRQRITRRDKAVLSHIESLIAGEVSNYNIRTQYKSTSEWYFINAVHLNRVIDKVLNGLSYIDVDQKLISDMYNKTYSHTYINQRKYNATIRNTYTQLYNDDSQIYQCDPSIRVPLFRNTSRHSWSKYHKHGMYVFTPYDTIDSIDSYIFKFGVSGDVGKRLSTHADYLPFGFNLIALVLYNRFDRTCTGFHNYRRTHKLDASTFDPNYTLTRQSLNYMELFLRQLLLTEGCKSIKTPYSGLNSEWMYGSTDMIRKACVRLKELSVSCSNVSVVEFRHDRTTTEKRRMRISMEICKDNSNAVKFQDKQLYYISESDYRVAESCDISTECDIQSVAWFSGQCATKGRLTKGVQVPDSSEVCNRPLTRQFTRDKRITRSTELISGIIRN
jgi:hypothetical protein